MKHKAQFQDETPVSYFRILRERLRVLAELEEWLERPMQWLGLLWLVIVVIDLIGPSNPILQYVAIALWILFLMDFVVRFALAPHKLHYLQHNLLTALSLIVPALRVVRLTTIMPALRAARGLKLARMVGSVNRTMASLKVLTKRGGFQYVLLLTLGIVVMGAAGIYTFEKDIAGGGGITDFGTALWWASMMMTTMGVRLLASKSGRSDSGVPSRSLCLCRLRLCHRNDCQVPHRSRHGRRESHFARSASEDRKRS